MKAEWFAALLLIIGVIWGLGSKPLRGIMLICVAGILLFIWSMPLTGFLLLRILELRAGPTPSPAELYSKGVRDIVVLQDMVEAAELGKQLPGSRLIISSNGGKFLYYAALDTGMPKDLVVLETEARDTQEQSEYIKNLLHDQIFGLVTWAGHIPRAVLIFRKAGLNPIAVPLQFLKPPKTWLELVCPSRKGLLLTEQAVHEYVGIIWISMSGLFK